MLDWKTLKHQLALANAVFRKMFGLTLKGNHVKTGNPTTFELQLMDCFTCVDGALALKLPSGKLIKSHLNPPKPPANDPVPATPPIPEADLVPATPPIPVIPPDTKTVYHLPCRMDNIMHPEDSLLVVGDHPPPSR